MKAISLRLDEDMLDEIREVSISDLKGNTNIDIKILKGYTNLLRMRINSYRIIYHVYKNEIIIIDVIDAGSRGQIYKNK